MIQTPQPVGTLLRTWRQRRRLTQMDLALSRLRRQVEITADPKLAALLAEAAGYASPGNGVEEERSEILVPLKIRRGAVLCGGMSRILQAGGARQGYAPAFVEAQWRRYARKLW